MDGEREKILRQLAQPLHEELPIPENLTRDPGRSQFFESDCPSATVLRASTARCAWCARCSHVRRDMTIHRHHRQPLAPLAALIALGAACSSSSLGNADTATCAALMTQYDTAYAQANVCDPTAANQCQQPVQGPSCLGACGALVQDPTAADAIVTKMINLGCAHPAACPCPSPRTYTCAPADGGGGTCTSSFAAPLPTN